MSSLPGKPVLECQDCGAVIRELLPGEAARVAANPYNYVTWCRPCQAEILRDLARRERAAAAEAG